MDSKKPLLHLLSTRARQNRENVISQDHEYSTPFRMAAINGDWREARRLLDLDKDLVKGRITKLGETALHMAVLGNHVSFIENLIKEMEERDLELTDAMDNTAFTVAASIGNVKVARMLLLKNARLALIRGRAQVTPLFVSVLKGKREMALYLYNESKPMLLDDDLTAVFLTSIRSGMYDLALKMLIETERLESARGGEEGETGLHLLARKHPLCDCERHCNKPEIGNIEFISAIMKTSPDVMWEVNRKGQSLMQIAILNRRDKMFNLIHAASGSFTSSLTSFVDIEGNNLLHSVGILPPQDCLNVVSGSALQMMLELSWFEEVKKLVPPSFIETINSEGLTPSQLFAREHEVLVRRGEEWMKLTANSCLVVAGLVAGGVYAASSNLPGGNDDAGKSPNYLGHRLFSVFSLSNSMALGFSLVSIMIFLSILLSRFAANDFRKSLPTRLIFGLVALSISIIGMMIAFCSAYFIAYNKGFLWVPIIISIFAICPVPVCTYLNLSLLSDIAHCVYMCRSLFRQNKKPIDLHDI